MENQSAILITLYKEEKERLESLIKKCLEDFEGPDYLLAHYHQEALYQVNRTIRMLNIFEDKFYDEKQFTNRLILKFQKELEATDSEYMRKYFEEQLKRYKEKSEKLNSQNESSETNDDKVLENALLDLVSKRIKKFRIVFNRPKNIFLELSIKGKNIKIMLQTSKNDQLHYSDLDLLEALGFDINNKIKPYLYVENTGDQALPKLKFLLIRLIFDVFYSYRDTNVSFIEF